MTGFLLGSTSTIVVESLKGFAAFDPLLSFIMIAQSIGVGFLCYTIVVFVIKKTKMAKLMREVGIFVNTDLSKTLSVAVTASVYISIFNITTIPIGLITKMKDNITLHIFLMDAIIGGLITAAVCYAVYSILIKKIQETEKYISRQLHEETENLATVTKESAETCTEQSSAVKEIVKTIADTTALSASIKDQIQNVSEMTEKAKDEVLVGLEYLKKNVQSLIEIMDTNKNTIQGIKDLGGKIGNIWDVVTLINEIASQAKIIAFNAELEASSAGEFGKNFHIVASEVRRLSDNIIDGTKEIKDKIDEIQKASDILIISSENGVQTINSGYESIQSLQQQFTNIEQATKNTSKSSSEITDFIVRLSLSQEQLYNTIKQISAGIESFTQTTENISSTSQNVKEIAKLL